MKSIEQRQQELNSLARMINLLIDAYKTGKKELEEDTNPFKSASKDFVNNYLSSKHVTCPDEKN